MKKGFTIVELLIVIVVIAILAAISIVAYTGIQNRANDSVVQSDFRQTYQKIQEFQIYNDYYPQNLFSEINPLFATTRSSYGGGGNALIYCRSNAGFAVVGRSTSGKGFYHSSVSGSGSFATWPGDGNANLCPAAGIPTTSPGYQSLWIYVNGGWQSSFAPGR